MLVSKRNTLTNDIIIIDGLWGTGKSILGPIISNMDKVEKIKVESIYEYISWFYSLGKINQDAAIWLLQTYVDASQYHNTIGREINLRWSDDTGLKNIINKFQYLKRLFGTEGDHKIDQINNENLALGLMSHMIMLSPDLLKQSFGKRIKVIETVRHPLYMMNHFKNYYDRFNSPREFTVSFFLNDIKIPWFAKEWEQLFLRSNNFERSVLSLVDLYPRLYKNIKNEEENGLDILTISFEDIVFNTNDTINKIEYFLDRKHTKYLNKILKKQKIPRNVISEGLGHSTYGFEVEKITEEQNYQKLINLLKENCSIDLCNKMFELIEWYNSTYPSKLSNLSFK